MKKFVLIVGVLLISVLSTNNFAQFIESNDPNQITDPNGSSSPNDQCISNLFQILFDCLSTYQAAGTIVNAGNQYHIYISYTNNSPGIRGRIQNCVASYNSNRQECANAPVMVVKN